MKYAVILMTANGETFETQPRALAVGNSEASVTPIKETLSNALTDSNALGVKQSDQQTTNINASIVLVLDDVQPGGMLTPRSGVYVKV